MRHLTAGLVVVVSVCLVAGVAPASAERVVITDRTADVWSPNGSDWAEAGSVANTDLRRTRVTHGLGTIAIAARYRDLRKRVSDEITLHAYLRTDRSSTFEVLIQVDWLGRDTSYRLLGRYEVLECDGLTGSTSFETNVIKVRVPRGCLGDPRWVRYAGRADSYAESAGLFVDDASGAGPEPKTWSGRLERD